MKVKVVSMLLCALLITLTLSTPAFGQKKSTPSPKIVIAEYGAFDNSASPGTSELVVMLVANGSVSETQTVRLFVTFMPYGSTQSYVINTGNETCSGDTVIPFERQLAVQTFYDFAGYWNVPQAACGNTPVVPPGTGILTFVAQTVAPNGHIDTLTKTEPFTITQ